MLDVVFSKAQLVRIDRAALGNERAEVVEIAPLGLHLEKVEELRRVAQSISNLLGAVGGRIAAQGHGIQIAKAQARGFETVLDRLGRKARVVFDAVETLLGDGRDRVAIHQQRRRRAGMKGVQEWLSFYFKSPQTAPGLYPEHDIFIQLMKLKNTLRHLRGEALITHLGLEYYD